MKEDLFQAYVKSTRDCDITLLDIAVNKGLCKARNGRIDYRKLFTLTASCAATVIFCFIMNAEPIKTAAMELMLSNNPMTQEGSEMLHGYITDISNALIKYFGGK